MTIPVYLRLEEELAEAIAREADRLGQTRPERLRTLIAEAVSLRRHAPALPRDLALALVQAYWSHYFADPATEAQTLLGGVEDAIELGELDPDVGNRLRAVLAEIPAVLHIAIAGRLREALELVRERGVPVEEAVVRAGLADPE